MRKGERHNEINGILAVIDGSKALRAAVRDVLGDTAIVQRCQVHKERSGAPAGKAQGLGQEEAARSLEAWQRTGCIGSSEAIGWLPREGVLRCCGKSARGHGRDRNSHPAWSAGSVANDSMLNERNRISEYEKVRIAT
jgi:hypothetical protein